jgi:hypothetical protein
MALDIQRLIDEVMGLVRERQDPNSRFNTSRRSEEEAADERKYGTELKKVELAGRNESNIWNSRVAGEQEVQRLRNEGGLAVQESENIGARARQGLVSQTARDVADMTSSRSLEGAKYNTDRLFEADRLKANDPGKVLDEWIKTGMITDPQKILDMRRKLIAQGTEPPPSNSISEFDRPDNRPAATSTIMSPEPTTPRTVVAPAPVVSKPDPDDTFANRLRKKGLWFGAPSTKPAPGNFSRASQRALPPWENNF